MLSAFFVSKGNLIDFFNIPKMSYKENCFISFYQNIHLFTSQGAYELRIDLEDWEEAAYAKYELFQTGNRNQNYLLTVDGYTNDGNGESSFKIV